MPAIVQIIRHGCVFLDTEFTYSKILYISLFIIQHIR